MTTWHQEQAMRRAYKAGLKPSCPDGFAIKSDAPGKMLTWMSFGENEAMARESLRLHRINQPGYTHTLYHNGSYVK